LVKLAVTSVATGLAPMSQSDWTAASDHTRSGGDDPLLPNNATTGDNPATFMATVSSNLAAGTTAPIVVVAGFPVDRKLLAWTVTPSGASDFAVSGATTLSSAFGGGTGVRGDASLSLANAPSGVALIAYEEDSASPAPGLHVATLAPSGALVADGYPQPSTSPHVRHAVIATDSSSRPAILYADGAGHILGSLLWMSAWLPAAEIATLATGAGAWSISNVWRPHGHDAFGVYRDAGATTSTTFSQVAWQ
jgi:hypothetical protein